MAYIPGFDHDIFISYTRADNIEFANKPGWVSEFCLELEKFMKASLNRGENLNPKDLSVWMDIRNIDGNDFWDAAIERAAQKSAVMISVLSNPYLQSPYCMQEIDTFCHHNEIQIKIGNVNKNRIFKVLIDNLPAGRLPLQIQRNNGYDFFTVNTLTKRVSQMLMLERGGFPNPDYRSLLESLADDLAEVLHEMVKKPEDHSNVEKKKVVYLAEVPDDLADERDAIRNTLLQKNIIVLPTYGLSNNSQNIEQDVEENLNRAEFYIHLLGPSYRRVSLNDNRSLTKIQHDIANEVGRRKSENENQENLKKIVWIKPGFEIADVPNQQHREFLQSLITNEDTKSPLEVIREPSIEILKNLIEKKILGVKKPLMQLERSSLIYVSHLPEDEKVAKEIEKLFRGRKHTVFRSLDSSNRRERVKDNRSRLRGCKAVVVLYGNEDGRIEIRERLEDAINISEQRRRNPILAKSLCDGPPDPKRDLGVSLNEDEWIQIRCRRKFDPDCFNVFFEKLADSEGR